MAEDSIVAATAAMLGRILERLVLDFDLNLDLADLRPRLRTCEIGRGARLVAGEVGSSARLVASEIGRGACCIASRPRLGHRHALGNSLGEGEISRGARRFTCRVRLGASLFTHRVRLSTSLIAGLLDLRELFVHLVDTSDIVSTATSALRVTDHIVEAVPAAHGAATPTAVRSGAVIAPASEARRGMAAMAAAGRTSMAATATATAASRAPSAIAAAASGAPAPSATGAATAAATAASGAAAAIAATASGAPAPSATGAAASGAAASGAAPSASAFIGEHQAGTALLAGKPRVAVRIPQAFESGCYRLRKSLPRRIAQPLIRAGRRAGILGDCGRHQHGRRQHQ
ncbi:hypothetical protein [Bosea sp. BIWAKO-01]|uniref:hypothetical protein n=1 Tax=Bosea sp. BIWAKO-01 TaxID=506668 RepID=UPI0008535B7B|nr:hypothetical protein [Bosea sp. BIWAKO-01]